MIKNIACDSTVGTNNATEIPVLETCIIILSLFQEVQKKFLIEFWTENAQI